MVHWNECVQEYESPGTIGDDVQFFDLVVQTVDSVRTTSYLETLVKQGRPVMMVGGAGTGKTTLVNTFMKELDETWKHSMISMNYFTDSKSLQVQMENPIDKRSGRTFGPPANTKLIYFVDDINLPYIEEYGTQNSLSLIRQHSDYQSFFDRGRSGTQENCCRCAVHCRHESNSWKLQDHREIAEALFHCQHEHALDDRLEHNIPFHIQGHLEPFDDALSSLAQQFSSAAILLHSKIVQKFLPSAVKLTYTWSMRELDRVFGGLCEMIPDAYESPMDVAKLMVHECIRTFSDRMNTDADSEIFLGIMKEVFSKELAEIKSMKFEELFEQQTFTGFHQQIGGMPAYLPIESRESLRELLESKLEEYNESNTIMDLVLFRDAIDHVCRIARIIAKPREMLC